MVSFEFALSKWLKQGRDEEKGSQVKDVEMKKYKASDGSERYIRYV